MRKRQATIKLGYEVEVIDEEGKVLERRKYGSQSFLKLFTEILRAMFRAVTGGNIADVACYDTGGVSRTVWYAGIKNWGNFHAGGAGATDDTHGLFVGSGITEVTPTDYAMASKIAHGTGAGQLQYGAVSIEAVETVGLVTRFRAVRVFSNGTGASIEVKEIGFAFQMIDTGMNTRNFLIMRDVLPSPVVVPAGKSLTVRYIISVTA